MLPAKLPALVDGCPLPVVKDFLDQLRVSDELFEIDEHPAIVRLRQQVEKGCRLKGAVPQQLATINKQLDSLLEPLSMQKWPVVIQHGDFAPWNILRVREEKVSGCLMLVDSGTSTADNLSIINSQSRLRAIDWEEGTAEGFPCFDLIYFCLQTGYLMHHWSAAQTTSYALNVLTSNGFNEQTALSLIKLSSLDAWLRNEEVISGSELQQFRQSIWSAKR
jgi:thiamine kinase-like enzyme